MTRFRAVTVLLSCLLSLAAARAHAVSVWIEPADTSVAVGDSVTLRVVSDGVPDLKGYQVAHRYDPARLQLVSILAGDLLTTGGDYFAVPLADVTAPADTAWLDAAKLVGSANGPGILAYYRFRTTAKGSADLECVFVQFRDSENATTIPACAGSVVHISGAVPALPRTWGRLKIAYR